MKNIYYVYILTNKKRASLYIGVTSVLKGRVWEHKNKIIRGFTSKYNIDKIVYYEIFEDINEAIYREKKLKDWKRSWKIKLIEKENPNWNDLYNDIQFW